MSVALVERIYSYMGKVQQGELERRLGTSQVLTIGIGTMVGAGIFVFPGLAAGEAGPAAMVSFAIGAGIALLVALPASELATAMPQSGGGYLFVSRSLGSLAGCVVGVGQWFGLLFASAFYLVGFGYYAVDMFQELGVTVGAPFVVILAVVAALLLAGVSIIGAEKTGNLQNLFVGGLLVILILFLAYGIVSVIGGIEPTPNDESFAPFGTVPILTTAALVFTSYLGFVQVATVGDDVKHPERNIPLGMIGGVVVVGALYVLMIFVSVSLFGSEELSELGETAVVEVGRSLLGQVGALALLGCGLLATLSSANASVMSASRAVYALSKDELVPGLLGTVNQRFSTPHYALIVAGSATMLLILVGGTEFLAQVASFLHLVMYGLICFAMIRLRYTSPSWYEPGFRAPGYPLVPLLGGVASFTLIGFMQPLSIIVGVGVVVVAVLWYLYYARDVTLLEVERKPEPAEEPISLGETEIIYPVTLPEPEKPSPFFLELLSAQRVVLVGCFEVARHTAAEQARDQFGEEAQAALEEVAASFRDVTADVETRLVFTSDPLSTIDRIAGEKQSDAIVIPRQVDKMERLLVPVRGEANMERILVFVGALAQDSNVQVIYLHVDPEGKTAEAEKLLRQFRERTLALGVDGERCDTHLTVSGRPVQVIERVVNRDDYDVVVIGETEPTLRERVLGEVPHRIAESIDRPVIVVQKPA